MDDQISELLDVENASDLDVNEQRTRINDILKYDKYAPDTTPQSPCQSTHTFTNPGIEEYCQRLNWGDNGWEPIDKTDVLETCPEYLPTDDAIKTLLSYDPLLEIGAGTGYWAYVLENAGAEIIATDMMPQDVIIDDVPDDYWKSVGTEKYNFISLKRDATQEGVSKIWTQVQIADHTCMKSYPSHTIMLCHPVAEDWTEDVLDMCHLGQELVFIGEWFPGADATPKFFKRLVDNWELQETFPVYDWASMHAHGYVFTKKNKYY